MSVHALSDVFGTELSAMVFGQHFQPILILLLLGLFEGQSLQQ
jgi:hypothetical protein